MHSLRCKFKTVWYPSQLNVSHISSGCCISKTVCIVVGEVLVALVNALEASSVPVLLVGGNNFGSIGEHHLDKLLGHRGRVVHAGTHVDLNQPRVQLLVDHEVVTDQLTGPLFAHHVPLAALDAPDHNVLDLLLDLEPVVGPDCVCEFGHGPHALVDVALLVVLLDAVVGEVDVSVVDVVEGEVVGAKPHVALVVEPYLGRIVVLD